LLGGWIRRSKRKRPNLSKGASLLGKSHQNKQPYALYNIDINWVNINYTVKNTVMNVIFLFLKRGVSLQFITDLTMPVICGKCLIHCSFPRISL
jgi:hypothetical protein